MESMNNIDARRFNHNRFDRLHAAISVYGNPGIKRGDPLSLGRSRTASKARKRAVKEFSMGVRLTITLLPAGKEEQNSVSPFLSPGRI